MDTITLDEARTYLQAYAMLPAAAAQPDLAVSGDYLTLLRAKLQEGQR